MKPSVLGLRAVPCLVPALLALALAPPLDARTFHDEITITELEIPVHVLRRGRSVHGLTRSDFQVFDEGEPREIVGFRAIDLRPPDVAGAAPEPPAARHDGRRLLLLFDLVFSPPNHLKRSLLGARELVGRQLHPEDRVAVAYLTGSGANLLLGFTRAPEEIATALDTLEALLDMRDDDFRDGLRRLSRIRGGAAGADGGSPGRSRSLAAELSERFGPATAVAMLGGGRLTPQEEVSAPFGSGHWDPSEILQEDRLRHLPGPGAGAPGNPFAAGASAAAPGLASAVHTISVEIDRLALLLRGVPGQKHMLYLSRGFDRAALERLQADHGALVRRSLEDLSETLRRESWTFHAMDVGGIPSAFSRSGFDGHLLFNLVEETGGLLFENYNRVHQATRRLVERTSGTYLLSIRPEELASDGRLHRLEVRLAEPTRRTRVLHRSGYHGPRPSAKKSPLERRLDTLDLILGELKLGELEVETLAGALPSRAGLVSVPVVVEIPAPELSRGREDAELQVEVFAVDARGAVQDLWLRRLAIGNDREEGWVGRSGLRLLAGLAVPPGDYRLRILVRDQATDRISLTTTRLELPAAGGLLALDPVIVDRSGDWTELVSLPAGPGGACGEALTPSVAAPRPVVPPVSPALRARDDLELLVVVAGGEPVDLTGRLLDANGGEMAGPVEFLDRMPGHDGSFTRYLARVATTGLAPGTYRVEVRAEGSPAGLATTRGVTFDLVD